MSETEQADETLRVALAMPAVAATIAEDARENLGGVEVVSVGSVFAREIHGVQCYLVVAIVPDRDGKDFVPSQVILDATQNYMVAAVNRKKAKAPLRKNLTVTVDADVYEQVHAAARRRGVSGSALLEPVVTEFAATA